MEMNSIIETLEYKTDSTGEWNFSTESIMSEFPNMTSNVTLSEDAEQPPQTIMLIIAAGFAIIIGGAGIIGNLITVMALLNSPKLRTGSTFFIVNLAVVEFLFCLIILPISAAQHIQRYLHNVSLLSDEYCAVFAAVKFTITEAEILTIMGIALTRAIVMRNLGLAHKLNRKRFILTIISVIWLYSISLHLPTALGNVLNNKFGSYNFNIATQECDIAEDAKGTRLFAQVVTALIPILIIFICYIIIYCTVKKSTRMVTKLSRRDKDVIQKTPSRFNIVGQTESRDLRVARSIFIIFIIILVCSIPIGALHRKEFALKFPNLFLGLHFLYWLQYCINPIVYLIMNPSYKKAFNELFTQGLHCWRSTADINSSYSNRTISQRISDSSTKGRKISKQSTSSRKEST